MSPTFYRRSAAAVVVCLVSAFAVLLFWPRPMRTLDVRLAGVRQVTNGVLLVSVVLSNGTPHTFNVVDDTAGKPLFVLDPGAGDWSPGSGKHGLWLLGDLANQHRVNLVPGASLTNAVWVTNPPPRFRLRVNVEDLTAVEGGFPLSRIVGRSLALKAWAWRRKRNLDAVLPASPWIETARYEE